MCIHSTRTWAHTSNKPFLKTESIMSNWFYNCLLKGEFCKSTKIMLTDSLNLAEPGENCFWIVNSMNYVHVLWTLTWGSLSNDPPGNLKHSAVSHDCSFMSLRLCSLDLTESLPCRTHTITTLMHGLYHNAILENVVPFTRAGNYICKSLYFLYKLYDLIQSFCAHPV